MKDCVCVSLEESQIKALDRHPLYKDLGRSGLIRIAVHGFLRQNRKEMSEKRREDEKLRGEK